MRETQRDVYAGDALLVRGERCGKLRTALSIVLWKHPDAPHFKKDRRLSGARTQHCEGAPAFGNKQAKETVGGRRSIQTSKDEGGDD